MLGEEPSKNPETAQEPDDPSTDLSGSEEGVSGQPEENEIETLKTSLEGKSQEVKELRDKLLRSYAEIENYKKRTAKDREEWVNYANEGLLKELLTVLDNLSRAKTHGELTPELSKWMDGVTLTIKQFEGLLTKFGVRPIEAVNRPFDPSVHQAMAQVESEGEEGTIVEEYQKGYWLHDRVLRPSMVTIAKKKN